MRPLKLEVSGLTCFREPAVIDFTKLELVAIEGPTGAGKSSLLDAMILALYGIVPRMGKKGLSELIAHGRSGLSVTLDFALRGTTWRVARTLSHKRPSQAILAELVAEGEDGALVEKKKCDGVQDVQREIKTLLGIDGAAFQQAVILPQGKFQEFLASQPAERRKILSELLGLQIYAAMRNKAAELASRLGGEVDALARQLAGDLSDASEEAIASLELEVAHAQREAARLADEVERARVALAETERVFAECQRLVKIDEALVVIEGREAMITSLSERAARARAVLPLTGIVERIAASEARVKDLGARVTAHEARVRAARQALEEAEGRARAAEIAAEQVVALRARIARLDEARGRFEQREALVAEEAAQVERLRRARAELAAAVAAEAEAAGRREAETAALEALEAAEVPAVAAEELLRWEALREVAARIVLGRAALGREEAALGAAREAVERAEEALAEAEAERKRREHAEVEAEVAREAAAAALAAAEQAARVALVREHLHVGEACPVCEQVVTVVPAAAAGSAVEGARAALEAAKKLAERRRGEAERARGKAAEARVRSDEATARASEASARVEGARAQIAADEAALGAVVDEVVGAGEGAVEARFSAGLARRQEGAKRREAHEAALSAKRSALERAREDEVRGEALRRAAEQRAGEEERAGEAIAARRAAVEAALAELMGGGGAASASGLGEIDPRKERKAAERAIAGLVEAHEAALRDKTRAAEAVAVAEAEHGQVRGARDEAEAERAAAVGALAEEGWTVEDVRSEALGAEELAAAEQQVAAHKADRAARIAERAAVVRALGPARADAAEVEAKRAAVGELAARDRGAAERAAVLGQKLGEARERLLRAGGLKAEHEDKARQLQVYKRLSDDLSAKHFQEFMLEEVIADLVRGASERLFALSGGRYRMAADSSAGFLVVDLDHAGERRSTDTLSGGETFLASLAMALELSEQIRAKAGRVDLDCIFIDEGFGTLDPETLETVTEAVEGLRRPGRLVGIITHVAELAQRMPERLVVDKSATGSTVRLIGATTGG